MKRKLLIITILGLCFYMDCKAQTNNLSNFIPESYVIYDTVFGDLNQDGYEDCVITIKGTDKSKLVQDEYRGELDRNRRGLIILLNKEGEYEVVLENDTCFYSENEDGGIYYPPQLSFVIKNGKLFVEYSHGRYGYWSYNFRFQNSDFELIGYDASHNYGPIIQKEISINFLSKKKLIRENINEDDEGGDPIFEETWTDITIEKLIKLSQIKDFEAVEMYNY